LKTETEEDNYFPGSGFPLPSFIVQGSKCKKLDAPAKMGYTFPVLKNPAYVLDYKTDCLLKRPWIPTGTPSLFSAHRGS
jgi:hypothetical protein